MRSGGTTPFENPLPNGFENPSVGDRIGYVHDLQEWVRVRPQGVPVVDWLKALIDERRRLHEANPGVVVPWAEVRSRLFQKYSRERT